MQVTLRNIFLMFFKIGAMLLGGGYVILPLLISEVVEKRHWINKEDLVEYYSISQCLPGIIAVNTAVFTGYKLKGKFGALAAAVGMCLAPFLAIILLASVLGVLSNIQIVKNVFWGVGIGIIIMIFLTVREVWSKSIVDKFTFGIFAVIFALNVMCDVSPVFSVIGAAVAGTAYNLIKRRID